MSRQTVAVSHSPIQVPSFSSLLYRVTNSKSLSLSLHLSWPCLLPHLCRFSGLER